MEVQSTQFNIKAISDVKMKIYETEIYKQVLLDLPKMDQYTGDKWLITYTPQGQPLTNP